MARDKEIKVVADLHENYPAGLQVWKGGRRSLKRLLIQVLFNNFSRWARYERECVQEVNKVIVVVDEAKKRLMKNYGLADEDIMVVMNVEDVDYFSSLEIDQQIISSYSRGEETFILSYIWRLWASSRFRRGSSSFSESS